jgi:hypothetical protein
MTWWMSYAAPGIVWFRLFGRGLVIRDIRRWPLMFSEREGYARIWRIGWLGIKGLRP